MEEKQLDSVLVPLGLAMFLGYHVWLLFTIIRNPRRTVVGINAQSRHKWVFCLMSVSYYSLFLCLRACVCVCVYFPRSPLISMEVEAVEGVLQLLFSPISLRSHVLIAGMEVSSLGKGKGKLERRGRS